MRNIGLFFRKVKVVSWILLGLWIIFSLAGAGGNESAYIITFPVMAVFFLVPAVLIEVFKNPVLCNIRRNAKAKKMVKNDYEKVKAADVVVHHDDAMCCNTKDWESSANDIKMNAPEVNEDRTKSDDIFENDKSNIEKRKNKSKKYRPSNMKFIKGHIATGVILLTFSLPVFLVLLLAMLFSKEWALLVGVIPLFLFFILALLFLTGVFSRATYDKMRHNIFLTDAQLYALDLDKDLSIVKTPLFLDDGEYAVYHCNASLQELKTRVVGHTGASNGVSVRIAKGVSLHAGRSAGKPVYGKVSTLYPGQMVITNRRVVFLSAERGFEFTYDKLTSAICCEDGLVFQTKNKSYELLMFFPQLAKTAFDCVLCDVIPKYE